MKVLLLWKHENSLNFFFLLFILVFATLLRTFQKHFYHTGRENKDEKIINTVLQDSVDL